MIVALLSLAFAQPPIPSSQWTVDLDSDARVVVFPRSSPGRIEVGVYHNTVSLRGQLEGERNLVPFVDTASVGHGTTYVSFAVAPGGVELDVARTVTGAVFTFTSPDGARPSPARADSPPLTPLDAQVVGTALLASPGAPWTPPVAADPALLVAPDSWAAIEGYRGWLGAHPDHEHVPWARYQLARAHEAVGLPREAHSYYQGLDQRGAPAAQIHLARARTRMVVGDWDGARQACDAAAGAGLQRPVLLQCTARVALHAPRGDAARRGAELAAVAQDAQSLLLAAQLLQSEHQHGVALPLLERALSTAGRHDVDAVRLAMGDALWATGALDEAYPMWAGVQGPLGPSARVRTRMAEMVREGTRSWARAVPELERMGRDQGRPALEALWLLHQIHLAYGDVEAAVATLIELRGKSRAVAERQGVDPMIRGLCSDLIDRHAVGDRPVEVLATAGLCWTSQLDALPGSAQTLLLVADAAHELGLPGEAVAWQRRAVAAQSNADVDDPDALLRLAMMYARAGRGREALETVEYLDRTADMGPWSVPAAAVEAEAWLSLGLLDDAQRTLGHVAGARGPAGTVDRRQRALLLRRMGRCDQALPLLHALAPDPVRDLALARCEFEAGNATAALALAEPLLATAETSTEASWTTDAASLALGLSTASPDPAGRWEPVRQELLAADRLASRVRR